MGDIRGHQSAVPVGVVGGHHSNGDVSPNPGAADVNIVNGVIGSDGGDDARGAYGLALVVPRREGSDQCHAEREALLKFKAGFTLARNPETNHANRETRI